METQHFREVGGKHPPELNGVTSPENYYLIYILIFHCNNLRDIRTFPQKIYWVFCCKIIQLMG